MTDNDTRPQDPELAAEVAKELEGVPSELTEGGDALADVIEALKGDLEAAKQDVLYAKAETQNVRRRMEKDIADARAYENVVVAFTTEATWSVSLEPWLRARSPTVSSALWTMPCTGLDCHAEVEAFFSFSYWPRPARVPST